MPRKIPQTQEEADQMLREHMAPTVPYRFLSPEEKKKVDQKEDAIWGTEEEIEAILQGK